MSSRVKVAAASFRLNSRNSFSYSFKLFKFISISDFIRVWTPFFLLSVLFFSVKYVKSQAENEPIRAATSEVHLWYPCAWTQLKDSIY